MKKVSLVLLSVFLMLLAANSVFAAGVIGTPHDITTVASLATTVGACSTCHIPHKSAGGGRLWAATMAGSSAGVVGNLCSSCHNGDGAGYGATLTNASGAENTVYSALAHGLEVNTYITDGSGADTEIQKSGLPYSDPSPSATGIGKREVYPGPLTNRIECTSCHNVHDNAANRPFLRVSVRDLCINCHLTRYNNGTTWVEPTGVTPNAVLDNWFGGAAADGFGLENPGSHPVGVNITGDMNAVDGGNADSPIVAWSGTTPFDLAQATITNGPGNFATSLMQPFDDGSSPGKDGSYVAGVWNLGLHVAQAGDNAGVPPGAGTAGGVVCVSCHAIHGVQDDSNSAVVQVVANANLLARPQGQLTESGMAAANGHGNARNNLCEICHFSSATSGAFNSGAFIQNDGTTAYAGVNRPNPGASPYTHPIDDALAFNEAVSMFPSTGTWKWPYGSGAGAGSILPGTPQVGAPKPICESCHVPHPARAILKGRLDVSVGTKANQQDYILRDDFDAICNRCHGSQDVSDHHPISLTTKRNGGVMGTDATFTVPGAGGDIGDGDNWLECNDCHNMTGAHNWTGPNAVGLDPNWEPTNNGRGTNDVVGGVTVNQSKTCEECHYLLRNSAARTVGTPTHSSVGEWESEAEFQKTNVAGSEQELGTHFLGTVNTTATQTAVKGWTAGLVWNGTAEVANFNPVSTNWPNGKGTGAYSRWDGTTSGTTGGGTHLVCESCHELEPDKNAYGSKLLVYYFQEDTDSSTVAGLAHAGDNQGTSYFCEGCHGANGPKNTHAMTNDTVTRTQTALITGSNYLAAGAPKATPATATGEVGYSTFPAADQLSCDSCHQTHDAATASTTYILDAPNGNVVAIGPAAAPRGGANHPDGDTTIDYTGFCDQCHRYTKAN